MFNLLMQTSEIPVSVVIWSAFLHFYENVIFYTNNSYTRFSGGKNKNNEEFLMANRSMGIFPATCSMVATYISAILVLGTPAEVRIVL